MSNETVLTDEHISEVFLKFCDAENTEFSDVARAIEQAVLQSEQVQAWKKDAERYRWLQDRYKDVPGMIDSGAIDAAMEKKP